MEINITDGGIGLNIHTTEITGTYIGMGKEYSYADLSAKISDDQFIRINCEWNPKGDIPEFVVALMGLIVKNKEKASSKGAWVGKEEEYLLCEKASLDRVRV